jgi:hypothetical protein
MSVTASEARLVMRARIETAAIALRAVPVPFRWQNEAAQLPDTPATFVYCEFLTGRARVAGYGGGRGRNLYRNPATFTAYVFVPKDSGLDDAEAIAEQIAALFRSYRDDSISCFDASVHPGGDGAELKPPGLASVVGNYFYAVAEISLHFDQIG